MENKKFEKRIKQVFDQYRPDLDQDMIWEQIEPHLNKKKRRRILFLWFFLAGLGYLIFHATYFSSIPTADTSGTILTNMLPELPENIESLHSIAIDEAIADNIEVKSVNDNFKGNVSKIQDKKQVFHPNNEILREVNEEKVMDEKDQITEELGSVKMKFQKSGNTQSVIDAILNIEKKKTAEKTLKDKNTKKRKGRKKSKTKNKWEFQLQPVVSSVLPMKILSSRVQKSYLNKRKSSETQLEAFSVGLNLRARNKKSDWIYIAGLTYMQFNERFDHFYVEENTEKRIGLVALIEDETGQIIDTESGLKDVKITETLKMRLFNQYRFLNIPFGVGKEWTNKNSNYRFFGGINYNLYFKFSGTIFGPDLKPVALSSKIQYLEVFKEKTGIGVWLSAEYGRAINDRLQWSAASRIQIPLSAVSQPDYGLKQYFYPVSLDLGIIYLLNPVSKETPK